MNDAKNTPIMIGCMTSWMLALYFVGVLIVGQVVWHETGVLFDTITAGLFWPVTAAVMVADMLVK